MEDQVDKKSIQKAFKTSFAHILKTLKSIEFLMVFGGPGCPVELKMVALSGSGEQLGAHEATLGRHFGIFSALDF